MRLATGTRCHHRTVAARAERGSTSIAMVLLMPALFAVMFLGMQGALYYHARTIALASAQEGARAAGAQDGTTSAGVAAARDYLSATAGDALSATRVTGSRSTTTATITVRGTPLAVIPLWTPPVVQSATVTVERITQ